MPCNCARSTARWGLAAGGADARALAGDDLVPEADVVETRAIDIDAPPDEVWPWLAQLGYGRGGWYGFAALDRPWSPGGGPIGEQRRRHPRGVPGPGRGRRRADPSRAAVSSAAWSSPAEALVLYLDDTMVREQVEELAWPRRAATRPPTASTWTCRPIAVSWAFVLEDAPGGRTRLIERLRLHIEAQRRPAPGPAAAGAGRLRAACAARCWASSERAEGAATERRRP